MLEIDGDRAMVQLFESSQGLKICRPPRPGSWATASSLAVSAGYAGPGVRRPGPAQGRRPGDHCRKSAWTSTARPSIPAARDYPDEFIQTGISAIDGLNTLVRGQKLPVFSGSGLPHANLAAQIARQARVLGNRRPISPWCSRAIGITFEEADFFICDFKRTGAIDRTVLFMNLANDPAIERIATPAHGSDRGGVSGL